MRPVRADISGVTHRFTDSKGKRLGMLEKGQRQNPMESAKNDLSQ
jgi:hypothetical protein